MKARNELIKRLSSKEIWLSLFCHSAVFMVCGPVLSLVGCLLSRNLLLAVVAVLATGHCFATPAIVRRH